MDLRLKKEFREETNLDVFTWGENKELCFTKEYVDWLEAKINFTDSSQLLLCNDSGVWENHLTNGKKYKLIYEDEETYELIDNSGCKNSYFKDRFSKVNAQ